MDNIGLRIISRQLKCLDEDLSTLLNKASFSYHKSYGNVLKEIDSTLILSVVIGKIIPFVVKYSDLEKQPVTNLMLSTGEAISKEVCLEMYKRDLKSCHISSKLSFNEYIKEKNLSLSEDELIKLGVDLIQFFTHRSNFVEVKEVYKKKDLYRRYLVPKEDFKKLLDNITYLESEEIPMIVPPVGWKINCKGEVIEYGGTLTNNEYRYKSLVSLSHKNPLVKKMKLNKCIVDTVNKMASTEYTINKNVLSILTEKEYLVKGNERLIHFKPHEESEILSKYVEDKNFIKVNEITAYNSKHFYDISILNIARLMNNVDTFYTTTSID